MMNPKDLFTPPAAVAPAQTLGELAAVANAGFHAGEEATRKGLDHYIQAGEALTRAKKLCGHGKWLDWVGKNLRFGDRQARKLMRLYRERDRLANRNSDSDLTIDEAAAVLGERDDEEPANAYSGSGLTLEAAIKAHAEDCERRAAERKDRRERLAVSGVAAAMDPPKPRHGFWYKGLALDPEKRNVLFEIAERPDDPGFWTWAFVHTQDGDCFVDYQSREMRLDGADFYPFGHQGVAVQLWDEFPVEKGLQPFALRMDDLDRTDGKGRYSWVKREREAS
jgi:hypothetical protein